MTIAQQHSNACVLLAGKHPNHAQIAEQIRIVDNGGYYIWNIKDDDIHVRPIKIMRW